ncbi:MAG: rhomboid family intramembrane serine protease [Bacteroidota bacterium]
MKPNHIPTDIKKAKNRLKSINQSAITWLLIAINLLLYAIEEIFMYSLDAYQFDNIAFRNDFLGKCYSLVTAGFLHNDIIHIVVNMLFLYLIGTDVEKAYIQRYGLHKGRLYYITLYLSSIISSVLGVFITDQAHFHARGASGGTHGLMSLYVLMYPYKKILFMPNWLFQPLQILIVTYVIPSYLISIKIIDIELSHSGHLAAILSGLIFHLILNSSIIKHISKIVFYAKSSDQDEAEHIGFSASFKVSLTKSKPRGIKAKFVFFMLPIPATKSKITVNVRSHNVMGYDRITSS